MPLRKFNALLFLMRSKIPPPRSRSGTPFAKGEILNFSFESNHHNQQFHQYRVQT